MYILLNNNEVYFRTTSRDDFIKYLLRRALEDLNKGYGSLAYVIGIRGSETNMIGTKELVKFAYKMLNDIY